MKLFACPECWKFVDEHPEDFASFGCGPGGLGDRLVPDTMYGLNISDACRIHDWYYRFYPENTEAAREMADRILKNNLLRIVREKTKSKVLRWLRERRCQTYYLMVRNFGAPAFFEERNNATELREVNGSVISQVKT